MSHNKSTKRQPGPNAKPVEGNKINPTGKKLKILAQGFTLLKDRGGDYVLVAFGEKPTQETFEKDDCYTGHDDDGALICESAFGECDRCRLFDNGDGSYGCFCDADAVEEGQAIVVTFRNNSSQTLIFEVFDEIANDVVVSGSTLNPGDKTDRTALTPGRNGLGVATYKPSFALKTVLNIKNNDTIDMSADLS
jgi:hypothetical protein